MTDRMLNAQNTALRQWRWRSAVFFFTPAGDEGSTPRARSRYLAADLDASAFARSRGVLLVPDRRMTTAFLACILVAVTFLAPGPVCVQAKPPQVFDLTLREDPTVKPGRVVAVEGVTDYKGHHFLVHNLDVMQPVAVWLMAREPSRPLKLQLAKYDWNRPDRSGITDAKGVATFRVRTQGDMKIHVTSETPQAAPYYLVVWVGDEVQPKMDNVLVPTPKDKQPQDTAPRDAASWPTSMIVIVMLLGVSALALIGVFLRLGPRGRQVG